MRIRDSKKIVMLEKEEMFNLTCGDSLGRLLTGCDRVEMELHLGVTDVAVQFGQSSLQELFHIIWGQSTSEEQRSGCRYKRLDTVL